MAIDYSQYGNWNDLINALKYTAPNSDIGTNGGYALNGQGMGTALYGDNPMNSTGDPSQGDLSDFFVPTATSANGYNTVLMRNPDGSIGQQQVLAHQPDSLLDKIGEAYLAAGTAYVGGAVAGAAMGGGAAAGTAGAAESAPEWTSGYDLAEGGALGETGAAAGGAADGALDVSGQGLNEFTDGIPNVESLGTTADGGLAYPGMDGYIPPAGSFNTTDFLKKVASNLLKNKGGAGGATSGTGTSGFNGQLPALSSLGVTNVGLSQAQAPQQQIAQAQAQQEALPNLPKFNFLNYQQITPGVAKHPLTSADPEQIAKIAQALKGGSWQT